MENVFSHNRPALWYEPRPSVRWAKRKFILWPVYTYKVVAPEPFTRQLNILEKAILGLCRTGIRSAEEIAPLLHIDKELADFILQEKVEAGHTDIHHNLTERGEDLLRTDEEKRTNPVVGFVFQDPWKNELWPRFMTKTEGVDSKWCDGFRYLKMGTIGDPKDYKCFTVNPRTNGTPTPPDAGQVLEASHRHWRGVKNQKRRKRWLESEIPADEDDSLIVADISAIESPHLKRVSLIEEDPQPAYLATFAYLPENARHPGQWQVCDPFGFGASERLRRNVEQQAKQFQPLRNWLSKLAKGLPQQTDSAFQDFLEYRDWEAVSRVEKSLGSSEKYPNHFDREVLFKRLVEMEAVLIEIEKEKNPSGAKLGMIETEIAKVFERVFKNLLTAYPDPKCADHLVGSFSDNKKFDSAAKMLGADTPLPERMHSVRAKTIQDTVKYMDMSVRPLAMTNLLCARKHSDHPLRKALQQEKSFFTMLDQIVEFRNKVGHDNPDSTSQTDLSQKKVKELVEDTYLLLSLLFDLPLGV